MEADFVDLKQDHGHRTIRRQLGEIIAKRRVIAFDDFVAVPITKFVHRFIRSRQREPSPTAEIQVDPVPCSGHAEVLPPSPARAWPPRPQAAFDRPLPTLPRARVAPPGPTHLGTGVSL